MIVVTDYFVACIAKLCMGAKPNLGVQLHQGDHRTIRDSFLGAGGEYAEIEMPKASRRRGMGGGIPS